MNRRVLVAAMLVGIGGGTLLAEPETAKPATNLSLVEMRARTETLEADVRADLRRILHLQEVTRKQKDVIKLNCVNEHYVELKAHANMFDKAKVELTLAGDDAIAAATSSFANATQAAADVHADRTAADGCVGENELSEESSAIVSHPDLDDPTLGDPFKPGIEPPAYASPFN